MINHPMNSTQVTDIGSHQTMEGLRPQRSPAKDGPSLRVILVFVLILALVIGISCIFSAKQTKEFSGELIWDGQSQSSTLVLTHTFQDKRSDFSTISGSIEIFDESGALLFSFSLSGHPETHTGYLSFPVPGQKNQVLFFDTALEQPAFTSPTCTFTAASPEFLDRIGFSSDS